MEEIAFIWFCFSYAHNPRNPSELVFIRFATFLHTKGYATSTIFAYLAGISSFMPPWVFRLISHDWNAPHFTFFDKDYVASLLHLEAPRRASPFPCFTNSGGPWTNQTAITWLSGQPSWLVSSLSFGHPISFQEVLGTLRGFYSYDAPTSSSWMRKWSLKSDIQTNQFRDRKVRIPIPQITRDVLCPMLALQSLFKAVRVIPSLPTFSYTSFRWIHYSELLNGVKRVAIVSDVDPLRFGCHSLCQGGATFAAKCGFPAFYIKLQGDWSSDCYTRYIALSLEAKLTAPSLMSAGVRSSC
jgi:hypothetical protein